MKYTIVVPVYLSRKNNEWRTGDVVYDHPTAINQSGTLIKTLESFKIINEEKFDVVLVISVTTKEIESEIDHWVKTRISEAKYVPKNLYIFTNFDLEKLSKNLDNNYTNQNKILSISGYSQVRNCGLIVGIINKSDAIIFLDDDELVRDKNFIKKINQGLNKKMQNKKIRFITGMCPEGETGSYIRTRKYSPWMTYWDKIKFQNEALSTAIEGNPRFKLSPLTHGGLCVIHKDIFYKIPFDPNVQRGEDMDYNLNCRMFGYKCYMDNELEIRHCPPPRIHNTWLSFREDMIRFLIQRNKIEKQNKKFRIKTIVTANNFDPYPGNFLKEDLEDMIFRSQTTLALEYLSRNELTSAEKTLENINIAREFSISTTDYFEQYMGIVEKWKEFTKKIIKLDISLRKL